MVKNLYQAGYWTKICFSLVFIYSINMPQILCYISFFSLNLIQKFEKKRNISSLGICYQSQDVRFMICFTGSFHHRMSRILCYLTCYLLKFGIGIQKDKFLQLSNLLSISRCELYDMLFRQFSSSYTFRHLLNFPVFSAAISTQSSGGPMQTDILHTAQNGAKNFLKL